MGERHSTPRRPLRRFFLVVALPGLPLLLLLLLGKGMRHEFSDLDYFNQAGERITSAQGARRLPEFALQDQLGRAVDRSALEGTFWLVAFMTTDTSTSPQLAAFTQQLLWANWRYRDEPDVGLLCFTAMRWLRQGVTSLHLKVSGPSAAPYMEETRSKSLAFIVISPSSLSTRGVTSLSWLLLVERISSTASLDRL